MPYLMIFATNMFRCLITILLFVINYPYLAKVQKEAYEKKEKERAKQARTHVRHNFTSDT